MSGIKKLANQTLWYGVPTIATRFLGYATNIMLFWLYKPNDTAAITQLYALIPFLNIVFTYGLETSYFRFAQTVPKQQLYNVFMSCILITTILFTAILWYYKQAVANFINMPAKPEYIVWMAWILFFDTLAVIPFAKLRQEGKPKQFAFIKVINIIINVALTIFFLGICPKIAATNPTSIWLIAYHPSIGIGYYVIANIVACAISLLLLSKQFIGFKFSINPNLLKQVMQYSYPLIIVGLGGMINEMLSRLVYTRVIHLPAQEAERQLGIFGANYKVAVLITIFIQVFKMGAEPFFFNKSKDADATKTYARVMKFFVIACSIMWLAIVTNLQLIQYVAYGKNSSSYAEGLSIIPILSMGSVFLGIYYNLSIWYKLTNNNLWGAYITVAGAALTLLLNIWWIPIFGYIGSAWATFFCYAFMMVISYLQGQKKYPIPYATKKLIAYMVITVLLYGLHTVACLYVDNIFLQTVISIVLLCAFIIFIARVERKEFQKIPVIGKYFNIIS